MTDLEKGETSNNSERKLDLNDIWGQLKVFLAELLDIRKGADPKATIEGIERDIPFKGHTAWILIFSIFIASIGLNTNSAAVVIGAMLISPLMGPILGIGLSVGRNDIDTLKRSLINFGVMVLLSILTAFIYFKISPFRVPSNEILNRTEPTLLDVLIAVFGGLAGIVAGSRKEKSNAIPGVAIATALMPPLCTAGFGLATSNWSFFFGALYLFGINTVFIALSTFVVVKYLRFPMAKYANAPMRKKVNRIVALVAVLVIIPSVISFTRILNKTLFENQAQTFIEQEIKRIDGSEVIKTNITFEPKRLEVFMIGDIVSSKTQAYLQKLVDEDERLSGTKLQIIQGQDKSEDIANRVSTEIKEGVLEELYLKSSQQISNKDAKILLLENEIKRLSQNSKKAEMPLVELAKEAQINYPELQSLSYAKLIETDMKKIDTINVFYVKWDKKIKSSIKKTSQQKLAKWLQFKRGLDTIVLKEK